MAARLATRMIKALLLSSLLLLGTTSGALAESQDGASYPSISLGGNLGIMKTDIGTGLFEMGVSAPIQLTESYSIGPWMQLGVAKNTVHLLFTANSRYSPDLFEGGKLRKLRPFIQGGLGLSYLSPPKPLKSNTEFLMNMGVGVEYALSDHMYVGSDVMFNVLVTSPAGLGFTTSWQFATLRYRF